MDHCQDRQRVLVHKSVADTAISAQGKWPANGWKSLTARASWSGSGAPKGMARCRDMERPA